MIEEAANQRPTIAVTMGDPGGIGPEIIVKALQDRELRKRARFRIHACQSAMLEAAERLDVEPFWWRVDHASPLAEAGSVQDVLLLDMGEDSGAYAHRPTERGGRISFACVEAAIDSCRHPPGHPMHADGIVTAPVSKRAWELAGRARWPGHTELLASRFGAKRVAMMFASPRLNVVLATIHIPLMDLRNVLTIGRIFDAIELGAQGCRELGIAKPRIAVCGVNPHAGEGGLFGDEETRLAEPAIHLACENGIDARGPFPADTVFNAAVAGRYDLVVAMYHDQGLIPVKLLDRDRAVNVTVGLPTVRTSPDHGTAFDIAGRGSAESGSMHASLALAIRMAGTRRCAGS